MKKFLFLMIAVSLVFTSCASAPKKEKEAAPEKKKEVAENSEDKYEKMLVEAGNLLRAGKVQDAVEKYIDPIITHYENEYKDVDKDIFCARSKEEMMTYLMAAAAKKTRSAVVLTSTWADALFYKAYIFVEFKKFDEAKTILEKAVKLSPYNSSYLSELGHIYQIQKNWKKSFLIFKDAIKYAEEFTPEPVKEAELTRAMRGVGYSLIELGSLDEAEKIYVECLKINREDRTAIQELMYIKKLKESREKPQEEKPVEEEKPAEDQESKV